MISMFDNPDLRIEENNRSREQFVENEINFGKLYLLSDLDEKPEKIYGLCKQREYVEYDFNVCNSDLEADRPNLRGDHMIFTFMFLSILAQYLNFKVPNMIIGKCSLRDVLLMLSRIQMHKMENGETLSEILEKAMYLVSDLEIDLDILRTIA